MCPASEVQTSIARFVRAGATGAHGTVNEPLNNPFPNAGALLHYTFGYSMGEAYLFNQRYLYWQNVHLGDPLATPYAVRPKVTIDGGPSTRRTRRSSRTRRTPTGSPASICSWPASASRARWATPSRTISATAVGDELDVLAIAVAKNAPVMRPGWIEVAQAPRADVQGWLATSLTVAPASQGAGGAGGSAGSGGGGALGGGGGAGGGSGEQSKAASPDATSGCGCRTVGGREVEPPALGATILLLGAAARRKRRRQVARV